MNTNDDTPPSQGNAFTTGYGHQPHGYVVGSPIAPSPQSARHVKAGFGANGGTIEGMGTAPRPSGLTIKRVR